MKRRVWLAICCAAWLAACAATPDPPAGERAEAFQPNLRPSDVVSNTFFFSAGRWDLDARAREQVPEIAASLRVWPSSVLIVDGYADAVGSAAANLIISQRRASAVGCALAAEGVQERIVTRAFGKTERAVPTPDNMPEPRNRRVVVFDLGASPPDSTPLDPATCATLRR